MSNISNKINPVFLGPAGISLRVSNSASSSCPFWPSTPSFRTPPSQSPPGLYVSASGMWCDTCYLWIPACPVALFAPSSITHACVVFQGRGAGARVGGGGVRPSSLRSPSPLLMNVVEIHNQVPSVVDFYFSLPPPPPNPPPVVSCVTKIQSVAKKNF